MFLFLLWIWIGILMVAVGVGLPRLKRNLKCMATGKSYCQCRRKGGVCV